MRLAMRPSWLLPVLLLGGTILTAFLGSLFLPGPWYTDLAKPAWTPPPGVFAPVWAALYATMGLSVLMIWAKGDPARAGWAYRFYTLQLVLNALWSFLFFGMHRPDLALLDVAVLLLAVVGTAAACWRLYRPAGLILLPLVAWVGFATALQFGIWRLNRG